MVDHLIECGDVLTMLGRYPDDSFHGCFCDPPYGINFMGKAWDHGVPSVEVWQEVLRVLKPGGMLLAFGGTRMWHRLAVNIEDAGFEIRDTLMWLYGSGFPKSHDISKGIDKYNGVPGAKDVARYVGKECQKRFTDEELAIVLGRSPTSRFIHWWAQGDYIPRLDELVKLGQLIKIPNNLADDWSKLEAQADREVVGINQNVVRSRFQSSVSYEVNTGSDKITIPSTTPAKQWAGYGTALKPAHEPILWAQKPLTTVPLCAILHEVNELIGGVVCQYLLSVNSAARCLELSQVDLRAETSVSVAMLVSILQLQGESVRMDMFNSPAAVSTCLSIAKLWSRVLNAHYLRQSTSTIKMETDLIMILQTLRSLILQSTAAYTIPVDASLNGWELFAKGVGINSSEELANCTLKHNTVAARAMSILSSVKSNAKNVETSLERTIRNACTVLSHAITNLGECDDAVILRPAWEPIILAMKPLGGTFAGNALMCGVSGINVDECRIPSETRVKIINNDNFASSYSLEGGDHSGGTSDGVTNAGRWPANVITDGSDEVVGLFPETGVSIGGDGSKFKRSMFGLEKDCVTQGSKGFGDSGSAARFFYCAKVSRNERHLGSINCRHPTLKPIKLTTYLAALIRPPLHIYSELLVPYSGAGSEIIGALKAGWGSVEGIDNDPVSCEWAEARINAAMLVDEFDWVPVKRDLVTANSDPAPSRELTPADIRAIADSIPD